MDNLDFEDFKDLDEVMASKEFKQLYDNVSYQPTGKSWAGNNLDYSGMTIEDFGR